MPIRFRCGNCNQLLGISRRKAGTVVRCPTCATEVVVPHQDNAPARIEGTSPTEDNGGAAPIFEGSDFGKLFEPAAEPAQPATRAVAAPAPPPTAAAGPPPDWKPANEFAFDVEPVSVTGVPAAARSPAARAQGIVVTPGWATILAVVVIILLALAFALGLGVGYVLFRSSNTSPPEGEASANSQATATFAGSATG